MMKTLAMVATAGILALAGATSAAGTASASTTTPSTTAVRAAVGALRGPGVPAPAGIPGTHAATATVTPMIAIPPGDGGSCTLPGWGGAEPCNSYYSLWVMPNRSEQVFVIGTDYAVWTRWELTPGGALSNWTSLGGTVDSSNPYVDVSAFSGWAVTLQVQGTDGNPWYLDRQGVMNGSWDNWHR